MFGLMAIKRRRGRKATTRYAYFKTFFELQIVSATAKLKNALFLFNGL
jgi:hypothetical protein